jgi:hypothetical protein
VQKRHHSPPTRKKRQSWNVLIGISKNSSFKALAAASVSRVKLQSVVTFSARLATSTFALFCFRLQLPHKPIMSFTELPHSLRVNNEGINTGITIISSWFIA